MIKRWLYTALLAGTLVGSGCGRYFPLRNAPFVQSNTQRGEQSDLGVIVVDMQDIFLMQGLFMSVSDEIKEEINYQLEVLQAARERDLPIFVLEYEGGGSTNEKFTKAVEGYAHVQFITKRNNSGFEATDLERRLEAEEVGYVILMGVRASSCVSATALGALKNEFEILTSPQLMTDADQVTPQETLAWFKEHSLVYAEDYRNILEVIAGQ